jgi:hypothetical protein
MKVKLLTRIPVHPKRVKPGEPPFFDPGHLISHPHAYKLVQLGIAVPADRECEEKCRPFIHRMDELVFAGERRERAIHHEDFDAYKQGLLIGYKPDGKAGDTWQPGKNWTEGCESEYYSCNEEEDDDE